MPAAFAGVAYLEVHVTNGVSPFIRADALAPPLFALRACEERGTVPMPPGRQDQPERARYDVLLAAVRHGRLELVRFLLGRARLDFKLDDEFMLDLKELCGQKKPKNHFDPPCFCLDHFSRVSQRFATPQASCDMLY